MTEGACRSCGARFLWAKTKNGKSIPLDPEPVEDGNMGLSNGIASVIHRDAKVLGETYYKSHFATCPGAASHRRK